MVGFEQIMVGYDNGEPARDALRFGGVMATATGAKLVVVHAHRGQRAAATEVLAGAEAALAYGARAEMHAIECRSVVQGLHDFAEAQRVDLIVVGSTTKGSLELHAVGTVAERLLRAAPCA